MAGGGRMYLVGLVRVSFGRAMPLRGGRQQQHHQRRSANVAVAHHGVEQLGPDQTHQHGRGDGRDRVTAPGQEREDGDGEERVGSSSSMSGASDASAMTATRWGCTRAGIDTRSSRSRRVICCQRPRRAWFPH